MNNDRYDASITNIRDTVKWLIGSIGAVFVTLLAGIQFSDVPFASSPFAAAAGIAAGLGITITFGLAIRTLVGGSLSFRDLATMPRFRSTRRFINQVWADPPGSPQLDRLWAELQRKDRQFKNGQIGETDVHYVHVNTVADDLLRMAKWHVVKARFKQLAIAMMLLIPIELVAAGVMFSAPGPKSTDTTLTIKLHSDP